MVVHSATSCNVESCHRHRLIGRLRVLYNSSCTLPHSLSVIGRAVRGGRWSASLGVGSAPEKEEKMGREARGPRSFPLERDPGPGFDVIQITLVMMVRAWESGVRIG